jgi:hypothetical protein
MTMNEDSNAVAWQRGFDAGWDRFTALLSGKFDPKPPANPYATQPEVDPDCCRECFSRFGDPRSPRMICCAECGNKRCPKATHHDHQCTGSNEPGQEGSAYA